MFRYSPQDFEPLVRHFRPGALQRHSLMLLGALFACLSWTVRADTYNGGGFTSLTPAAGWKVKGLADYNNDGQTDIVFQNSTTHQVVIWFMNGLTVIGGNLTTIQPLVPYLLVGPH